MLQGAEHADPRLLRHVLAVPLGDAELAQPSQRARQVALIQGGEGDLLGGAVAPVGLAKRRGHAGLSTLGDRAFHESTALLEKSRASGERHSTAGAPTTATGRIRLRARGRAGPFGRGACGRRPAAAPRRGRRLRGSGRGAAPQAQRKSAFFGGVALKRQGNSSGNDGLTPSRVRRRKLSNGDAAASGRPASSAIRAGPGPRTQEIGRRGRGPAGGSRRPAKSGLDRP